MNVRSMHAARRNARAKHTEHVQASRQARRRVEAKANSHLRAVEKREIPVVLVPA